MYDTYDKAKNIKRLIEEIYRAYSVRSSGREIPKEVIKEWCDLIKRPVKDFSVYSVGPWHGYFESLEDVHIEVFPIKRYK